MPPLASLQQHTLQRSRQMPAILDRPQPIQIQAIGPINELIGPAYRRWRDGTRNDLPRPVVDGGNNEAVLVAVHTNYNHASPF